MLSESRHMRSLTSARKARHSLEACLYVHGIGMWDVRSPPFPCSHGTVLGSDRRAIKRQLHPAHLPFAANVTARMLSRLLTVVRPYPRPRCASSGKGHSHAATVELTFSRQPARADHEKPVSEGPTGYRSRGNPPERETGQATRAAPLLLQLTSSSGEDPRTSCRTDPRVTPEEGGEAFNTALRVTPEEGEYLCRASARHYPQPAKRADPLHFPLTHGHLRP
jgi:hypothetical protein